MKRKKRRTPQKGIDIKLPKLDIKWPGINPLILSLAVLAIVLLIVNLAIIPPAKKSPAPKVKPKVALETAQTIRNTLAQFGIFEENISPVDTMTQVLIPRDFSFYTFFAVLRAELENINTDIVDCKKVDDDILMSVGKDNEPSEYLLFTKSRRVQAASGNAAIIIDDFGYSDNRVARAFLEMQVPLTISIIPGLNYSQRIAELANLQGKQVMVHMPMEPLNEKVQDDGFTLYAGQDAGKVSLRLRQAFAQIPVAKGLNNHQGSKATADAELMNTVMQTLQGMNKFFVDSWTSPQSVAYDAARRHNIQTAKNLLFLDAKDDRDFIREQMNRLARMAKEHGDVIAIGHVRRRTLSVLEEMIPILRASGVTFVYASEVVN